jgi:hypothetical protein
VSKLRRLFTVRVSDLHARAVDIRRGHSPLIFRRRFASSFVRHQIRFFFSLPFKYRREEERRGGKKRRFLSMSMMRCCEISSEASAHAPRRTAKGGGLSLSLSVLFGKINEVCPLSTRARAKVCTLIQMIFIHYYD